MPLQVKKDLMTVNFDIFNTKSKAKFSGFQRRNVISVLLLCVFNFQCSLDKCRASFM